MKQTMKLWLLAAILTICGAMMLASCSNDDDPARHRSVGGTDAGEDTPGKQTEIAFKKHH